MALALCLSLVSPCVLWAGLPSKAIQEAAEYVFRKGGKEATELGLETITKKIETLVLKYGDDAVVAVKKAGPKTFRIVEEAGENGLVSVKLLARYGDDAVWVVAKKKRLAIFVKFGDDAAESLMKHGEIAESLLGSFGKPAAGALKAVSTQNGRRLAMMADDATLSRIGRTDELLAVVAKYGDGAMNFIWNNKGALTVAATLTAFLANPQPFIDGTVDITKTGVEGVVTPVATEIGKNTNWTLILGSSVLIVGAIVALKLWLRHRATAVSARPIGDDAISKLPGTEIDLIVHRVSHNRTSPLS